MTWERPGNGLGGRNGLGTAWNGLGTAWEWPGNGLGTAWEVGTAWEQPGNGLGTAWERPGNGLGGMACFYFNFTAALQSIFCTALY